MEYPPQKKSGENIGLPRSEFVIPRTLKREMVYREVPSLLRSRLVVGFFGRSLLLLEIIPVLAHAMISLTRKFRNPQEVTPVQTVAIFGSTIQLEGLRKSGAKKAPLFTFVSRF
jgi:hypothetical protein